MAVKIGWSGDAFGPTLRAVMARKHVTYRQLAESIGLSAGYLCHLVAGSGLVPSSDVIESISAGLQIDPAVFLEYRLRFVAARLQHDPGTVDRLYRQIQDGKRLKIA